VKKNAPTLDIDALCADLRIRELDAALQKLARESANKTILSEAVVSQFSLEDLSIDESLFDQSVCASLPEAMAELRIRPAAHECLRKVWSRSFSSDALSKDIEMLASELLAKEIRIRKVEVSAQDPQSGEIMAHYPSPQQVRAGLPVLAKLVSEPCCELPFISAFIAMVYFYRLHPLPDGNGRTSRAMINICLRNYGVIAKPAFLISPLLIRYLPQVEQMIRRGVGDPHILFILLMKIALKTKTYEFYYE